LGDNFPHGVQGQRRRAQVGVWGKALISCWYVQCNIVNVKTSFCASSVCILLLKHALKLKRRTVRLLLSYFRGDVPC